MGRIVKETAALTADRTAWAAPSWWCSATRWRTTPSWRGAFHGVGEADCVINVGVSGPGVVHAALEKQGRSPLTWWRRPSRRRRSRSPAWASWWPGGVPRLGVPFGIVDLSLAPTPAIGDSVARILEEMGLEVCGSHGTTAALALLNDAVKKGGVMASSSHVGGLSGAFIPVSARTSA